MNTELQPIDSRQMFDHRHIAWECVYGVIQGTLGMAQMEAACGSEAWRKAAQLLKNALRDMKEIEP